MFTHSPTDARTYSFTKPQAAVDSDELSYADLGTLSNNVKPMSMAPVRLIISNYLGIYDKLVQSTPTYQALRSKVTHSLTHSLTHSRYARPSNHSVSTHSLTRVGVTKILRA